MRRARSGKDAVQSLQVRTAGRRHSPERGDVLVRAQAAQDLQTNLHHSVDHRDLSFHHPLKDGRRIPECVESQTVAQGQAEESDGVRDGAELLHVHPVLVDACDELKAAEEFAHELVDTVWQQAARGDARQLHQEEGEEQRCCREK